MILGSGQFCQCVFICRWRAARGFFQGRDAFLVEQNFRELFGGAQVEWLTRFRVGTRFQFQHLVAELAALRFERGRVDQHAVAFHREQDFHGGQFDLLVDVIEFFVAGDLRVKRVMQLQRDIGIFCGVIGGALYFDLIKSDLRYTPARHILKGDGPGAEVARGQRRHVVALVAFQYVAFEQGVVLIAAHFDAVIGKHVQIVFVVLSQFLFCRVFEPGLEFGERHVEGDLGRRALITVHQWKISRLAGRNAEGKADDLRLHLIEAGGFGVERGERGGVDSGDPGVELRFSKQGFVVARVDEFGDVGGGFAGRPACRDGVFGGLRVNGGSLAVRSGIRDDFLGVTLTVPFTQRIA